MNKNQFAVLNILAGLLAVGIIHGAKTKTTEQELCRRAAIDRLASALNNPDVSPEAWAKMVVEEAAFLAQIAKL